MKVLRATEIRPNGTRLLGVEFSVEGRESCCIIAGNPPTFSKGRFIPCEAEIQLRLVASYGREAYHVLDWNAVAKSPGYEKDGTLFDTPEYSILMEEERFEPDTRGLLLFVNPTPNKRGHYKFIPHAEWFQQLV